ncbi:hypothetical protein [Candidatus Riesia pediculischaeffi]|uniref:Uncharacterized protein n=1 Tax=Candidatus Riesia pediculischaeffi PTSU TaxID=1401651 RepID=A0A0C1S9V0_9ENTR|nr:hypothetical protein [Candidatus Riesia pediculischaeffi]KIE64081.1 hypothetical protein P689_11952 [Candidatus Riesia pediculischaeffi PTSU]
MEYRRFVVFKKSVHLKIVSRDPLIKFRCKKLSNVQINKLGTLSHLIQDI